MFKSKLMQVAGNTINCKFDIPEGVSFDGVNDYLSRNTDLTGNTDSKTFTFSCWIYWGDGTDESIINFGSTKFRVRFVKNTGLTIACSDQGGTSIFNVYGGNTYIINTWLNVICSCNLSNGVYKVVINDSIISGMVNNTLTDSYIDFTTTPITIGTETSSNGYFKGRLSHLFLDYTYRDLSIESNRRLFITEDGKPAKGLEKLNPIIYLPMKDKATAHINLGTGGDFEQHGLIETADRGPNQDNCVASEFDGEDDYLSSGGIGGTASTSISMSFNFTPLGTSSVITTHATDGTNYVVKVSMRGGDSSYIQVYNGGDLLLNCIIGTLSVGVNYAISVSLDLTDVNKRHIYINGINYTNSVNWSTYVNGTIPIQSITTYYINRDGSGNYQKHKFGELYFDTTYIDLATNNPFWDNKTNRPVPVRKVMAKLGSNPLICMPIDVNNPGKNYGSGGDFTVNGGKLKGARGASEYIARSAVVKTFNNAFILPPQSYYAQSHYVNKISRLYSYKRILPTEGSNVSKKTILLNIEEPLLLSNNTTASNLVVSVDLAYFADNEGSGFVGLSSDAETVHVFDDSLNTLYSINTNLNAQVSPRCQEPFVWKGYFIFPYADGNSSWHIKLAKLDLGTGTIQSASVGPEARGDSTAFVAMVRVDDFCFMHTTDGIYKVDLNSMSTTSTSASGGGGNLVRIRAYKGKIFSAFLSNYTPYLVIYDYSLNIVKDAFEAGYYNSSVGANVFVLNDRYAIVLGGDNDSHLRVYLVDYINGTYIHDYEAWGLNYLTGASDVRGKITLIGANNNNSIDSAQIIYDMENNSPYYRIRSNGSSTRAAGSIDFSTPYTIIDRGSYYVLFNSSQLIKTPKVYADTWYDDYSTNRYNLYSVLSISDTVDLSKETNKNLFINQLGYPRDLKPLIADGTIPKPLVYLPFDDPTNLGKNLGTAGDFTVNGEVIPGPDFTL